MKEKKQTELEWLSLLYRGTRAKHDFVFCGQERDNASIILNLLFNHYMKQCSDIPYQTLRLLTILFLNTLKRLGTYRWNFNVIQLSLCRFSGKYLLMYRVSFTSCNTRPYYAVQVVPIPGYGLEVHNILHMVSWHPLEAHNVCFKSICGTDIHWTPLLYCKCTSTEYL